MYHFISSLKYCLYVPMYSLVIVIYVFEILQIIYCVINYGVKLGSQRISTSGHVMKPYDMLSM